MAARLLYEKVIINDIYEIFKKSFNKIMLLLVKIYYFLDIINLTSMLYSFLIKIIYFKKIRINIISFYSYSEINYFNIAYL